MSVSINSMSINGSTPRESTNGQSFNKRWWNEKDKDIYQAVQQVFSLITKYDTKRATQYQLSARLYANTTIMGSSGVSLSNIATSNQNTPKDRISYNLVQSVVDTLVSKTSKNQPKPMFLTSGGDYHLQDKAKKLEKFVDGIHYANDSKELDDMTDRDCFVFGDGIQHVYVKDDEIKIERVLPSELIVDQYESIHGKPRQIHRFKNVDRMVLCDMFPEKKSIIMECNSASDVIASSLPTLSDEITVLESWHLPSGKTANDGKHCITINSGTLLAEEYTKDYFPFVRLSWCKRLYGYWAQGLAEQLQPIQLEINKILYVIQKSLHMAGSFKVFVENGSKIVNEHLTNDIGAIINYNGTPPQYVTPPVIQPVYFDHLTRLKQYGYEQAGISMLSAASQKPSGLDSGRALREFNDIETERFLFFGHEKERFVLKRTEIIVDMAKDIYEKGKGKKGLKTKFAGKKFIETIEWKDVAMEDDEYFLKVYPVSSFPQSPEAKMQTIIESMQAGLMAPKTGKKLLDYPDLEQAEDLDNAEEEYLNKVLQAIASEGKYTAPDTFDDPNLSRELCLKYMAKGKLHNLEAERMALYQTFIDQIDLILEKSLPPPPPPVAQANPMPTPTSPMLPNVNQGVV